MNSMMFMREDGQMGTCRICGKNFGLMGGGSEPYTGHNLQVCNSCGEVLKKIDKVKNEDTQEVKDLFVSVMSMTDDADVKQILTDYSKSVISDSEKLVAITNESKEKAERAQNIEENFYDLEKAFKVTTGYDFEGYQIVDYKGIVSGDIVLGTGFISEFAASWSDAFGTTSNTFAGKMKTAKQKALKQLMANAMITGANLIKVLNEKFYNTTDISELQQINNLYKSLKYKLESWLSEIN